MATTTCSGWRRRMVLGVGCGWLLALTACAGREAEGPPAATVDTGGVSGAPAVADGAAAADQGQAPPGVGVPSGGKEPVMLEATRWELVALGDQTVAPSAVTPWLRLDPATREVVGNGGCNGLSGPYESDGGGGLRFGNLAVTQMACADGMELEGAFFAMLAAVRRAEVAADELRLSDAEGHLLARLRPGAG
jgi:heat shock protein HslJ